MKIPPRAPWTVLIYTSASHDLEQAVEDSLQEITDHGIDGTQVQVVAQRGRQEQAQRFQLHDAQQPLPLGDSRAADMTRSETLEDFLSWGMEAYPAERYVVVLGGHAAGFAGALTNSQRTRMMRLPEIEKALGELPRRPDLLVFNTCLMAQAEAAEQFSSVAPAMVASQSQLKGLGLPLAPWLGQLFHLESPQDAASQLVEYSRPVPERAPAVTALDLEKWPKARQAVEELALQVPLHPQHKQRLLSHIEKQVHLWPRAHDRPLVDQLDLRSLCQDWAQDLELPQPLRQAASGLVEVLPEVVLGNSASPQEGTGLSLYAPDRPFGGLGPPGGQVDQIYQDLRWAQSTSWDEAIDWLTR